MAAGTIRASWIQSYMADPGPSNASGAALTATAASASGSVIHHIDELKTNGFNTVFADFLPDTPGPVHFRFWKNLLGRASARGMSIYPFRSWHNQDRLAKSSTPARRYYTTISRASVQPTIPCPLDPVYVEAMFENEFAIFPGGTGVGIDIEFPAGGVGGFHAYVNPCHCPGCLADYWRFLNTNINDTTPVDTTAVSGYFTQSAVGYTEALLTTFAQGRHRDLVASASRHLFYTNVAVTDIGTGTGGDCMTPALVSGLTAAGKNVTVIAEATYSVGFTRLAARQTIYSPTTVIGGLWQKFWSPLSSANANAIQNQITAMGSGGYWIFTTYSEWLGQNAQDALATSSDYTLRASGTASASIAQYYAAYASVNT